MVALYDYTKKKEDELTFTKGDILDVKGKINRWWYKGVCNGEIGVFPMNYVELGELVNPHGRALWGHPIISNLHMPMHQSNYGRDIKWAVILTLLARRRDQVPSARCTSN